MGIDGRVKRWKIQTFKNQWDDTGYGTSHDHLKMNLWIITGRSMMKFQVV